MTEVYAIGRVIQRKEVIGYNLLNMRLFSTKIYTLDTLKNMMKSGMIVGNLYYSEKDDTIKEYYCGRLLTHYSSTGKRIGKAKDIFLTVTINPSSSDLNHYNTIENYYSSSGLLETMDMLTLNYVGHYEVDNLASCLPFMTEQPVDMYVKTYQDYFKKISGTNQRKDIANEVRLDYMGVAKHKVTTSHEKCMVDFCRGLETFDITEEGSVDSLTITSECDVVLPGALKNLKINSLVAEDTSLCYRSFVNCEFDKVDLRNISRNSRDDLFYKCKVRHLILPDWYDSWSILDYFDGQLEVLEITNNICTNIIWEIDVQDKLSFRKVKKLVLPYDFESVQEDALRESLNEVIIERKKQGE